jgi:glycerol uptake facilitator-like aquaporin
MSPTLPRRLAAEALGTAIALLANAIATGAILVVIIMIFIPVSGAHFNPAVTLCALLQRQISARDSILYIAVQCGAGLAGVFIAHLMFGEEILMTSTKARAGIGQWTSEFVATFGLIATILGCVKWRTEAIPYAVGLYITAGYWFTSSTSFANPAVTLARSFTDTFSGILPADAPAFIAIQFIAAAVATPIMLWTLGGSSADD